jgi:fructoselysine 3-epimerase
VELQRFAFSSSAFVRHPLKKTLKRIARAGFSGVELVADKPQLWLDTIVPRDIDRLAKQLDKLNLFVSNIRVDATHGFWSDPPQDPIFEPSLIARSRTYREWRIAYTKKALRLAKMLGAQNLSLVSGRALPGVPPETAQKLLVESVKRLVEEAENLKQRFSMGYRPGLFIENSTELLALIGRVKSSCFGADLDVVTATLAGENPVQTARKLSRSLFHVHLADMRDGKDYARLPGDGKIDFAALLKALDAAEFTGPATWDIPTADESPDEAALRCLSFTKKLASAGAKKKSAK